MFLYVTSLTIIDTVSFYIGRLWKIFRQPAGYAYDTGKQKLFDEKHANDASKIYTIGNRPTKVIPVGILLFRQFIYTMQIKHLLLSAVIIKIIPLFAAWKMDYS